MAKILKGRAFPAFSLSSKTKSALKMLNFKAYRILQIVHGGKLLRIQNKIQFTGKHSRLTVRSRSL